MDNIIIIAPIITLVLQVIRNTPIIDKLDNRWLPLFAVILGIIGVFVATGVQDINNIDILRNILDGLLVGTSSSGIYSLTIGNTKQNSDEIIKKLNKGFNNDEN